MVSKRIWERWKSTIHAKLAHAGNAKELGSTVKEVLKLNNEMVICPSNTQSKSQVFTTLNLNFQDVRDAFEYFLSGVIKLFNPSSLTCKVGKKSWPPDDMVEKMNGDVNYLSAKWLSYRLSKVLNQEIRL
ncbi:hypothetical protein ACLB2K_031226 [Fragaria x ananassa]